MSQSLRLAPLVFIGAIGCTSADLYIPPLVLEHPLDDKLALDGGFCAEGADELQGFLKIMLIVDRSNSMLVTDPNNNRITAAADLVARFIDDPVTYDLRNGVEFAVLSFFGNVITHTRNARGLPGFSSDGPQILFSLSEIARVSSNTGYDKALAQAFLLLDTDMAKLSDKARSRSRYEVIFLSDGLPFPDNCDGESNSPQAAIDAADRIHALSTFHKVPLRLHTAFASAPGMFITGNFLDVCNGNVIDPNRSIGQETRALLQAMAAAGEGSFTQFENGDAISFAGFEFADARRIYALSSFIAYNTNAMPSFDHMRPDSDGDGIADADEDLLGTSFFLADSDFDGFADGIEQRFRLSGLDPLDPTDAQCGEVDRVDTDGDGLRDCEELFLGTLRRELDSDADGLPDLIEWLAGSDAVSANPLQDRQADSDADGLSNHDEVRWHTDPRVVDVGERSKIAYNYTQSELPITQGQACYDFAVDNLTLASTRTAAVEIDADGQKNPEGWNRIYLYFAQTPYDDPLGDPIYRLACVDARFVEERDLKIPAGGSLSIPTRRPSDTYRAAPTVRPNNALCEASVNQDCGINALWCRYSPDGSCNCWLPPQQPTDPADGIPMGACPVCSNGLDDDGDGETDFPYDGDCFDSLDTDEANTFACSNGLDDDGDGRIDFPMDPGCDGAYENDENNGAATECADGVDNDSDGAIDFPNDPGCFAAVDGTELQSVLNPIPDCGDGLDNDGDGLVDLADAGCFDPNDIDEDGPAVCFFCELFTDSQPGQCDIRAGYCRPRSGVPDAGACTNDTDCRGSVCDTTSGACSPCLRDRDCDSAPSAGDGVCDPSRGWCLRDGYTPTSCTGNAECGGQTCDPALGLCPVDPFFACRTDRDCRPDQICSETRGFCLEKTFRTAPCDLDLPCATGTCDLTTGFCVPSQGSEQCRHDDECPFGFCLASGGCDQQSFVFPEDFDPSVDCLRAR